MKDTKKKKINFETNVVISPQIKVSSKTKDCIYIKANILEESLIVKSDNITYEKINFREQKLKNAYRMINKRLGGW